MARKKRKFSTVYVVSIAVHLLVGGVLALVPQQKLRDIVAIALNEAPKKDKLPDPPKPPAHAPDRPTRAAGHSARAVAAPVAGAAAPEAAAFADIGLALDSSSEDGIAVNIAPPTAAPPPQLAAEPAKPKVLVARPNANACTEDLIKARPLSMVRATYTENARRARIEGRVRLEITVNERGEVANVQVLQALGFGLDEAAIAAARRLHFAPATRCGKPVAAPFILAMRFVAGS